MRCCDASLKHRAEPARRWRGVGSFAGSGALLVLLPKCPMCIAVYLAAWTGVGMAAPVAAHLRFALGGIFVGSLIFLLVRCVLEKGGNLFVRGRN